MDAYHFYGSDLMLSATGDILAVDGSDYGQQRVLRRLLTNPTDYVWHQDYGGGLPRFVGQVANGARIKAVILQQMKLERRVSQSPGPTVTVAVDTNSVVTATIRYVDAVTGATTTITRTL